MDVSNARECNRDRVGPTSPSIPPSRCTPPSSSMSRPRCDVGMYRERESAVNTFLACGLLSSWLWSQEEEQGILSSPALAPKTVPTLCTECAQTLSRRFHLVRHPAIPSHFSRHPMSRSRPHCNRDVGAHRERTFVLVRRARRRRIPPSTFAFSSPRRATASTRARDVSSRMDVSRTASCRISRVIASATSPHLASPSELPSRCQDVSTSHKRGHAMAMSS
ncbi:hypothetical protein SCHPADRAFT_690780 [Schizopora paradoxa]|uniref:C2H2-type domain-containing protein n=1 Tax=Schizopora paradoxa TaxID=27342 RepID=A0A0H2R3R6_9AGAM|nr:hypothetical protein SCHPADRAFT_690780 [Schizopora paradoxa]